MMCEADELSTKCSERTPLQPALGSNEMCLTHSGVEVVGAGRDGPVVRGGANVGDRGKIGSRL